jgi:histone H3/H4
VIDLSISEDFKMSRAYRIRVKESIARDLSASDKLESDLEIMQILPKEQMSQLLKEELKKRGFHEADGELKRTADGVEVCVDAETGHVTVQAEAKDKVELEGEREGWGYDDVGPSQESIKKQLGDQVINDLNRRADQQQTRLQEKATEKLQKVVCEVGQELNQAVNQVTRDALKQKAQSLGRVKEMSEDAEAGTLTIKVEV